MKISPSFLCQDHHVGYCHSTWTFHVESDLLILQKISKPFITLKHSRLANLKMSFNLFMLNDFTSVSEIKMKQISYKDSSFARPLPHFHKFLLKNTGINHIDIESHMPIPSKSFQYITESRKTKEFLRSVFKNKQGGKLSVQKQPSEKIDHSLELFNFLLRRCKLSSFDWPMDQSYVRYFPNANHDADQVSPLQFQKFARYLTHLSEFILQEDIATKDERGCMQLVYPHSSLTSKRIQLQCPLPLQKLILNPFNITSSSMTYLSETLKFGTQLKVLTLGIRAPNNAKFDLQQKSLPTNLSVEEFTLVIWSFKTDKDLTASLNLFLGSIDVVFPSLRKFSLESQRQETEYQKTKKPSALKLGAYVKNLGNLKHLQMLSIDSDICKGINLDSLGDCSGLTSLKIITNPILESAKIKGIPQNITELNLTFQLLRHGGIRFAAGHQQLISDYFGALKQNQSASDNIQILTLTGYEMYPRIASFIQFSSLMKLSLIDCRISEEILSQLLNSDSLTSLQELNLSRSLVVDSTQLACNLRIFTILEKTQIVEQLEVLRLSEFRISQNLQFPKDPQKFKSLRKLELDNNDLQVGGLNSLFKGKFPKLEELNIEYIKIVAEMAIPILSEKLKLIDHIKHIYLSLSGDRNHLPNTMNGNAERAVKKFHEKSLGYPKIRILVEDQIRIYNPYTSGFLYYK